MVKTPLTISWIWGFSLLFLPKFMQRYLDDGQIEIDNNLVENAIRPVALGRKNYLFAGSPTGAEWAAIFYSLFASARKQNLDPMEYLVDVLHRLPDTKLSQVPNLLPHNWTPSEHLPPW